MKMYLGYCIKDIRKTIYNYGRQKGYPVTLGGLKKISSGELHTAFNSIVQHGTTPKLFNNRFKKPPDNQPPDYSSVPDSENDLYKVVKTKQTAQIGGRWYYCQECGYALTENEKGGTCPRCDKSTV